MAETYDQNLRKVYALTGVTKEQFDAMKGAILELSLRVPKSADDLSKAMYQVASAGYTGQDGIKVLEAAAKGATAGLTDTRTVADALTSILAAYKLKAEDAGTYAGKMNEAVKAGKVEFGAFAAALGPILGTANAAGVSFDQIAASMATMTRVGLSADEAVTSIRQTILALEAPSGKTRAAIAEMGLTTDQVRKMVLEDYAGTLQTMMDRTGGNVEKLHQLFPNIRSLAGVLSTTGSQGKAYAEILDGIKKSGEGALGESFNRTMEGFSGQWALFKNNIAALLIPLGEKLLPMLVDFAKWAIEVAKGIGAWVEKNPELAKFALIALGVAAGLSAISFVLGPLIALLTGPAGLVVALAAIGLAVIGMKGDWDKTFDAIHAKTKGVTDAIGNFLGGVKAGFEEQTKKTLPEYADAFDRARDRAVNPFRESVQKLTDGLPPLTNEMAKSNAMARDVARATELASEQARQWDERGRKLGEALGWLWEKVLKPIAGWLLDTFIKNVEAVIEVVTRLFDIVGRAIDALGKLKGPGSGGPATYGPNGEPIYNGPAIPGFARGGFMPYTGLAYLHAGERVLTRQQQDSGFGGLSGTVQFVLPVYVNGKQIDQTTTSMPLDDFLEAIRRSNRK